jgi:hypothetical protein
LAGIERQLFEAFLNELRLLEAHALRPQAYLSVFVFVFNLRNMVFIKLIDGFNII